MRNKTRDARVKELLSEPDESAVRSYYAKFKSRLQGLEIKCVATQGAILNSLTASQLADAGPNRGKGIFALKTFEKGDLVLRDPPLVATQVLDHVATKGIMI
eukprot:1176532-Prorocentrum_minimum.AAC.2